MIRIVQPSPEDGKTPDGRGDGGGGIADRFDGAGGRSGVVATVGGFRRTRAENEVKLAIGCEIGRGRGGRPSFLPGIIAPAGAPWTEALRGWVRLFAKRRN